MADSAANIHELVDAPEFEMRPQPADTAISPVDANFFTQSRDNEERKNSSEQEPPMGSVHDSEVASSESNERFDSSPVSNAPNI